LIEKNYGDPKLYKKAEEIAYVSAETPASNQGAVKTVVRYKTEKSTIEYRLRRDQGAWRIYDMVIDDLSVAESNRSQFRKEIRKTSYQGLVQKLKEKLAES
jgi:phospholipid transport system substrate-binding protein